MSQHKYIAFISYAHADVKFAAWLHKSIEGYHLPPRLQESFGKDALKPVCRDRDDLRSGSDLGAVIKQALGDSAALIVVCSESAAASPWVNREIRVFREQHGSDRIFAIIARDEPSVCFPEALLEAGSEPIAADARPDQDGRSDARLKLIAGLLEVDFDALKQRDLRRRYQRMSWIAAGSLVLAVVMTALAVVAVNAREEAERRRLQAEDLIGFMLGDLRTRLEPIGRLDVLDAVGDKAVDYFAALDDSELDGPTQLAHAQALRQIGEVRVSQGNLEAALEAFTASNASAQRVVEQNVSESSLYELSQSHFWVGYSYYAQNELDAARQWFADYLVVAEQLVDRIPGKIEYEVEVGYARSNLGALAVERADFAEAERHFRASAAISRKHLAADADNVQLQRDLAETLSWLARTAAHTQGPAVVVERYSEERALRRKIAQTEDYDDRFALANTSGLLSEQMVLARQLDAAQIAFTESQDIATVLVAHDDSNAVWRKLHASTLVHSDVLDAVSGRGVRLSGAQAGVTEYRTLMQLDAANSRQQLTLIGGLAQLARLARLAQESELLRETLTEMLELLDAYVPIGSEEERAIMARCYLLAGDVLDPVYWQTGLTQLGDTDRTHNPLLLLTQRHLAERLGRSELVSNVTRRLTEIEFRDTQNGTIVGTLVSGVYLTD